MKIRSAVGVIDAIDEDLAWRKRELTRTKFLCGQARDHDRSVLNRASVVLAYAHLEGFLKCAVRAYCSFLNSQGLRYAEVTPSLVALTARGRLVTAERANSLGVHIDLVSFLLGDLSAAVDLPADDIAGSLGTVNTDLLGQLARLMGFDSSRYEKRWALIDERLVRNRHLVAHGERIEYLDSEVEDIRELALSLIEDLRTDIQNSVVLGSYRR